MSPVLISIFEYNDYRALLRDYFIEQKKNKKFFSNRYFARSAGFSSSGFLAHVMEGKRNLTVESIKKLSNVMKLRVSAATFFEVLVLFNQANSSEEKFNYFQVIEKLRQKNPAQNLNAKDAQSYFESWYLPAIRELAVHVNWKNNYGFLGGLLRPPISADKAEKAVKTLLNLKLLFEEKGQLKQSFDLVSTQGLPTSIRRAFRLEMIMRAVESMDTLGSEVRHISGLTVSMSEKSYAQVAHWIDELRGKILEKARFDNAIDHVYHYNFHGFPLTKSLTSINKAARKGAA